MCHSPLLTFWVRWGYKRGCVAATDEELADVIRRAELQRELDELPLLGFGLRGPILDRAWGVVVGLAVFAAAAYVLLVVLAQTGLLDDLLLAPFE